MNIIVADDEKWVRSTIIKTIPFEKLGLSLVCEASNGLEALELCKLHRPDILVTDIMMPGLTGLELIKELKKVLPDIKIVIISGHSDFDYAKTAMNYGIQDYILKPVDEEEITHVLSRMIETISGERRKKELEIVMESEYKQALPVLCEKYLNQLIQPNLFTVDAIKNKLNKYKIHFIQPHFTLALLLADVPSVIEKDDDQIYFKTMVIRVMGRYWETVVFSKSGTDHELIILINHKNHPIDSNVQNIESDVHFNSLLQKSFKICKRLFFKKFHSSISIGISLVAQNMKSLPDLYSEAGKALQMRFWEDTGSIFYYKPIQFKKSIGIKLSEQTLEELALQIKISDCTSIDTYIDDLHKHFLAHPTIDPEQIKEFLWMMIQSIINKLNIQLSFIDEISLQFNQHPYEKVKRINSLDHLIDFIKALINDICIHYQKKNQTTDVSIIELAQKFINENFNQDVTLEQVARYVHLSPAYFSEVFKKNTGMSFIEYKTARKIDNAKILLTTTQLTIYEISNKIGYDDHRYFSKLFKRETSMTPYSYREANKTIS